MPRRLIPLPISSSLPVKGAGHALRTAPCGNKCVLRGDVYHDYCSCDDATCQACHGRERFQARGKA
jgi:hypothetical protein